MPTPYSPLVRASKLGEPFLIEVVGGRVAAHLFELPGGLVFFDLGWRDAVGAHPIHVVEGPTRAYRNNALQIDTEDHGTVLVRPLIPEGDRRYWAAWQTWRAAIGPYARDREEALRVLANTPWRDARDA